METRKTTRKRISKPKALTIAEILLDDDFAGALNDMMNKGCKSFVLIGGTPLGQVYLSGISDIFKLYGIVLLAYDEVNSVIKKAGDNTGE